MFALELGKKDRGAWLPYRGDTLCIFPVQAGWLRLARALASFGAGKTGSAAEALLGVDWKDLKVRGRASGLRKRGERPFFRKAFPVHADLSFFTCYLS
jgi:hypothetical protein